jgi:hypothetical protein
MLVGGASQVVVHCFRDEREWLLICNLCDNHHQETVDVMGNSLVRVLLLIVYVLLAYELSLIFVRADGQGSYAPPAILFSWGILAEKYGWVSKPIGFWIIPVVYIACLFRMMTVCARSPRIAIALLPFAIHGFGALIALRMVNRMAEHDTDATHGFVRTSYVIAAMLVAAYLLCDWWLARKLGKVPLSRCEH